MSVGIALRRRPRRFHVGQRKKIARHQKKAEIIWHAALSWLELARVGAVPKTTCSHAYRGHNRRFGCGHWTGGHNCNGSKLE
jgi:hypothetical protein